MDKLIIALIKQVTLVFFRFCENGLIVYETAGTNDSVGQQMSGTMVTIEECTELQKHYQSRYNTISEGGRTTRWVRRPSIPTTMGKFYL